jgi:hypothetical protein
VALKKLWSKPLADGAHFVGERLVVVIALNGAWAVITEDGEIVADGLTNAEAWDWLGRHTDTVAA